AEKERLNPDSIVADPDDPAKYRVTKGEMSVESDVTNLFRYLEADPDEDVEEVVRQFVNSTAETMNPPPLDESNIVAVIRHQDYVDEANASGFGDILHEPLAADLAIVYMADRPESIASIKSTDLPGKDLPAIREIALNNLRRWLLRVVSSD